MGRRRGRRRVGKGGIPDVLKDRTRSDSEDGGRRRRVRTEALEDPNDPHNRFMRESLLSGGENSSSHVDLSLSSGIVWGGQDDIRVGRGNVTDDVVIRFELNDLDNVRVLVAEKMYRPPLVKAPRALADLMQRCWSQDPCLRPSFNEIYAELDAVGRENDDLDSLFPFEIANLVNYAADHIVSPLPPTPYSKGGNYRTPRSSEADSGSMRDSAIPPISPNSLRIYETARSANTTKL